MHGLSMSFESRTSTMYSQSCSCAAISSTRAYDEDICAMSRLTSTTVPKNM